MEEALGPLIASAVVALAFSALMIAAMWKLYAKANQPGWAALVPIYNLVVLLKIVGKPTWWLLLFCVPLVNFIVMIVVYVELAKVFGKGTGFALGLLLFSPIFLPILAFGDATYGAVASGTAPAMA